MKLKKKDLVEIIDGNGNLIGDNGIPSNGSDLESQANNTTDYNSKIGTQPFRYDMLGRFGFTLMPFMEEGKEDNDNSLMDEITKQLCKRNKEILKFYHKNPNKLKPDYRKISEENVEINKDINSEYAKTIIGIIQNYIEENLNKTGQIDESKMFEDMVRDRKNEDEISKRGNDNEVREKKLEKIADLISKLNKSDVSKLMNLLEIKNNK